VTKTVAVVMGGWSPEREVSLSSGRECAKALVDRGYQVRLIDVDRDLPRLMRALEATRPLIASEKDRPKEDPGLSQS